jgi:GNAT superfamily N-acetyltransferase
VRSWQVGYRGLLPADSLAGLRPEDFSQRYTFEDPDPTQPGTLVAVKDDSIVGFATTGPCRDDDTQSCGELMALYVDPPSWGSGTGRALIAAAREALLDQGFTQAVLWVLAGNTRAERFYRHDGWSHDGVRRHDTVWGLNVDELRYRRTLDLPEPDEPDRFDSGHRAAPHQSHAA